MECVEEETGGVLVEFLEAAVSSIIYLKGVYPSGAFERRKYMKMVVQTPRHPQLRHYIHSSLSSLLPFLLKGVVDRVAVIFWNGNNNIPVEKFVFRLTINHSDGDGDRDTQLQLLQDSLRLFLIKLPLSQPLTNTNVLPQGCRWEINAYFRSLPQGQGGTSKEPALWIPTGMKQWQQPPLITPIKSMSSGPLCVQLYLEHPSLTLSV